MTDFHRINAPRIAKIEAMIATIRKSAKAQKISAGDVAELLAPVAALVAPVPTVTIVSDVEKQRIAEAGPGGYIALPPDETPKGLPRTVWKTPPHILQIDRFVADLQPLHLPIYIKHLVHRLCERADDLRAE